MAGETFTDQRTNIANATPMELLKVALIAVLLCIDTADAGQNLHLTCIRMCNMAFVRCTSKACPPSISTGQNKREIELCKKTFNKCYTECNMFLPPIRHRCPKLE
ncbi:hypothetical protein LSAT2_007543 [Lamellibrachia satsuma]|nr:hypothetical protein LSAT2_007543 [Lamellibrachia satsuma]